MFGLFKERMSIEEAVAILVDNLIDVQKGFDKLAFKKGLTLYSNYEEEAGLLIYLAVGIFGIQASAFLGHRNRQKLSVELTGRWAENVYGHENLETIRSLQDAFNDYNRAENLYGNSNVLLMGCAKRFIQKLDANYDPNTPNFKASDIASYLSTMMLGIKSYLEDMARKYKFE